MDSLSETHEDEDSSAMTGTTASAKSAKSWPELLLVAVSGETVASRGLWIKLFDLCVRFPKKADPSKWMLRAAALVEAIGLRQFRSKALRWLASDLDNPDFSTGLVWCLGLNLDDAISRAIVDFGLRCVRSQSPPIVCLEGAGLACVRVLARNASDSTLERLAELESQLEYASARMAVWRVISSASKWKNQRADLFAEMAVPTYGLRSDGKLCVEVEEYLAQFEVQDGKRVVLGWSSKTNGKAFKSVPKRVKLTHPELLAEFHRKRKEMSEVLTFQRQRIESFFLTPHEITYSTWLRRYVNQPLIGAMTKTLVWYFDASDGAASGVWRDTQVVGWDNEPLDGIEPETKVRLWHPLLSNEQTVLSWRCWLEDHDIQQPFKQAFREVYLLTPAEEATETYSNRFAGQIVLLNQFGALCRSRGWGFSPLRDYPSLYGSIKSISTLGMRAELDVQRPQNDSGYHIVTGSIRFYTRKKPLRLSKVPSVIFSEILRDIDTFTTVASIGSDPDWDHFRGAGAWRDYAFGSLSQTAETRRAVLERVLPTLKIASRCEVDAKFLSVRGDLHTYKIHLGSTNVLMEPGSRFLCIQSLRGEDTPTMPKTIFLPFEGDYGLAVILSKAFLLAADTEIKDRLILNQIMRD